MTPAPRVTSPRCELPPPSPSPNPSSKNDALHCGPAPFADPFTIRSLWAKRAPCPARAQASSLLRRVREASPSSSGQRHRSQPRSTTRAPLWDRLVLAEPDAAMRKRLLNRRWVAASDGPLPCSTPPAERLPFADGEKSTPLVSHARAVHGRRRPRLALVRDRARAGARRSNCSSSSTSAPPHARERGGRIGWRLPGAGSPADAVATGRR